MTTDRKQRESAFALAAVALLVGLGLTAGTVAGLDSRIQVQSRDRFEERAIRAAGLVEAQLEGYLGNLRGVGAYLLARGVPTADEVDAFAREARVFQQTESLLNIIVLHRVTTASFDEFVRTRRVLDPSFEIKSIGDVSDNEAHYIVTYEVPGALELGLPVGLDVSSLENIHLELEARGRLGHAAAGAVHEDPLIRQLAEAYDGEVSQLFTDATDFFLGVPMYPIDVAESSDGMPVAWITAVVGDFDTALARMLDHEISDLGIQLTVPLDNAALQGNGVGRIAERPGSAGQLSSAPLRRDFPLEISGLEVSMTVWSDASATGLGRDVLAVVGIAGLLTTLFASGLVYARVLSRHRTRVLLRISELQERSRFQAEILASVDEAVVVLDTDARVVVGNDAWSRLCSGGDATDVYEERRYLELVHLSPAADGWMEDAFASVLSGERESVEVDLRLDTETGRTWSSVRITPLHADPGGLVVVHRDITDRKRTEQDMQRRATHDQLTGLLNRAGLEEAVPKLLEDAGSAQVSVAALFIDLDDFKEINDTYGHTVGDAVLRLVAQRITGSVRASDLTARVGGDEFVVLVLDPMSHGGSAVATAERILQNMSGPLVAAGVELTARASIGVVVVADAVEISPSALLQRADSAMYDAKREGGARFVLCDT